MILGILGNIPCLSQTTGYNRERSLGVALDSRAWEKTLGTWSGQPPLWSSTRRRGGWSLRRKV